MQWEDVSALLRHFITEQSLPENFLEVCKAFYFPLACSLLTQRATKKAPLLIGINGAQGTGKSTLAALLQCILEQQTFLRCATISIDDLYLTRAERSELAQRIHPLLQTRGVPGTHDVELGLSLLNDLIHAQQPHIVPLPRFDKARDDRKPLHEWSKQIVPVDVIIVEGWCVGSVPQSASQLASPVNELEANEDVDGQWRNFVNQQLADQYQRLFDRFDLLIMLKAPCMDAVKNWRWLQEQKLIRKTDGAGQGLMTKPQVTRFIQHYERLTRHTLEEMPDRADVVFHFDDDHQIAKITGSLAEQILCKS